MLSSKCESSLSGYRVEQQYGLVFVLTVELAMTTDPENFYVGVFSREDRMIKSLGKSTIIGLRTRGCYASEWGIGHVRSLGVLRGE